MDVVRALVGLVFFLLVAWALGSHRKKVQLRVVVVGLLLQLALAYIILQTGPGRAGLEALSSGVAKFLSFSNKGAEFVFGPLTQWRFGFDENGQPTPIEFFPQFLYDRAPELTEEARGGANWSIVFALRALPTIIFFSAFMAILYHLGIIQFVVSLMARFMMWAMRVSGAEALAMAANVFVGQTEAPLVVKPYISTMTQSELMTLMTGGFATIAGSVLAAYIGFLSGSGIDAGHLLAASVMSAPAAFVIAKIMLPETETPTTRGRVSLELERTTSNVLDAAATGTADGLKLYLNVLAMLIAFVSLIAVVDWPLGALGDIFGIELTLKGLLGQVFSPVAWLMGVPFDDCRQFGSLLGTKIGVNEFVAFSDLGSVALKMESKSRIMAAYALCGFANFASIGIQLGGIGPLAPERRSDLVKLALRAMIGGAMASWMTATIAGMFV